MVEVIIKFAKLYDNVDFEKDSKFDDLLYLDFIDYRYQSKDSLLEIIIETMNLTPQGFKSPPDYLI